MSQTQRVIVIIVVAFLLYAEIKNPEDSAEKVRWLWDEFLNACQRLTRPEQGQFALTSQRPAPDSEQWEAVLRSFGGSWYNKELSKSNVDAAGSMEAIQFFWDLEFKHRVTPTAHQFQFNGDAWRGAVTAMAFNVFCSC